MTDATELKALSEKAKLPGSHDERYAIFDLMWEVRGLNRGDCFAPEGTPCEIDDEQSCWCTNAADRAIAAIRASDETYCSGHLLPSDRVRELEEELRDWHAVGRLLLHDDPDTQHAGGQFTTLDVLRQDARNLLARNALKGETDNG